MKSLLKNLIFVISLSALIWLGYIVFFKEDEVILEETEVNPARVGEQEFLSKLKELQSLDLETSLFTDEEFLSLVNHTVQVVDEEAGRPNPFAPVPGLETKPKAKTP
jgi:hypothetical protein